MRRGQGSRSGKRRRVSKRKRSGRKDSECETNDNVLNLVEIETLRSDSRGDHDVLGSGLEGLDSVLSLFLG